jgi:hypothetical protein
LLKLLYAAFEHNDQCPPHGDKSVDHPRINALRTDGFVMMIKGCGKREKALFIRISGGGQSISSEFVKASKPLQA